MKEHVLPCCICDKKNSSSVPPGMSANQPHNAISFSSYGHYGSKVFDPMDGTLIEVNICDDCIVRLAAEQKVLFYEKAESASEDKVKYWKP